MLTDAQAIEAARRIRERAPVRCHRIGKPEDELPPEKEPEPMPRGKKNSEPTPAPVEAKQRRPYTKKQKAAAGFPDGAKFGVYDDGTIQVNLPSCSGIIGTDDARDLITFARRIGIGGE